MYSEIGKAIEALFKMLFIVCCLSTPLAIWKIIDIVIWVIKHIKIGS